MLRWLSLKSERPRASGDVTVLVLETVYAPPPSLFSSLINTNARSAGPHSCALVASQSPVSCNFEKVRFSGALHAPTSRGLRCRFRWPRASAPQLRCPGALWQAFGRASRLTRRHAARAATAVARASRALVLRGRLRERAQ